MQTSRRSILKGSILASLAGTMGATAMSASAAEKQAALPKKEYDPKRRIKVTSDFYGLTFS